MRYFEYSIVSAFPTTANKASDCLQLEATFEKPKICHSPLQLGPELVTHEAVDCKSQRRVQRHQEARDARHDDAPEGRIVAGDVGRRGREEPAEDVLKLDQVENGARHAAQDKHEHDDEQDPTLVDLLNLELAKFCVKNRSLIIPWPALTISL